MSNPFIGEIIMFGANFAPRGWALCDGQLLPIAQNTALFSILGTTYGGDGRTTFALPELRGRIAVHPGNGPGLTNRRLGEKGGVENVTLTTTELPSHNHAASIHAESDEATSTNPNGRMIATPPTSGGNPFNIYADVDTANIDRTFASQTLQVPNTGGGQSHTNIQPFQCVNFIIALQGTFPSRS